MKETVPEDEREEASWLGASRLLFSGRDKADESGDIPNRLLSIHGSGALGISSVCLLRVGGASSKAGTLFP